MKLLSVLVLLGPWASMGADFETETILIKNVDVGSVQRGPNNYSPLVINKTESLLTLVLDLRADPGLWLRKSQRQFVYLLYPKHEQILSAEFEFLHMSPEAFLRGRVYFPDVATGVTRLSTPFFDQRYAVGAGNKDLDYDLSHFRKRETAHYLIYCFPGSLAEHDIDRIALERDRGFEKIAGLLGVQSDLKIRLFFFPDEYTKRMETGHQGAGWAFGNNIIEVYNEKTRLDPYHETAHILAGQLGSPAALLNEGFAVFISELLGADALRELGSPGKTCDQAVIGKRSDGNFIALAQLLSFDNIGSESTQPSTSYPEACSVVRFLVGRFGWGKFREAFSTVSAGNQKALEKVYGAPTEEIERAWLTALASSR